jgi:RNA polymerase sigma-70 factor (ECF subfamily)
MSEGSGSESFVGSDNDARFGELHRCYFQLIRAFCRRRLESDLVDDAVAEVFLTAWRRLDSVPAGDAALIWLYGVAYREVGHQWRSTARRRRLHARLVAVVRRPASAVDEALMDGIEHRLVLDAAAQLDGTDAEVLRLVAWEQLAPVDIAAVLEITPNAVNQRLHRAKRNLAREYRRLETRPSSNVNPHSGGVR